MLPGIGTQQHDARDLRPLMILPAQQSGRTVMTAIINEYHFITAAKTIKHRVQACKQQRQDILLIENRNYNRQLWRLY